MEISKEALDRAARAAAARDDYDGCFDRIDEWEAQSDWEKDAYPDEYPSMDYEDREFWRKHIRAALEAAAPLLMAQAWDEGMKFARECADETTDSFGNLYRIDWLNRMDYEIERNPYRP